jgi:hypothetical protein
MSSKICLRQQKHVLMLSDYKCVGALEKSGGIRCRRNMKGGKYREVQTERDGKEREDSRKRERGRREVMKQEERWR